MYIPTNQTVTVYRPGEKDFWGNSLPDEVFMLKCRAEERVQVVTNRMGEEVTSSIELLFRRLPDIKYSDEVEYTNEVGLTVKREPQLIAPARHLGGKPAHTSVYL